MAQNTLTVSPSGYSSANSSYSGISSSYPITNAYANSSSTSYAYITMVTGSRASTYVSLTFDLSSIPDTATIDSITCKAKGRVSSTSYVSTAYLQLYDGATAMGSTTNFRTTTATVYTLSTGTWNRSQLNNLQLRYTATRGTSNTTRAAYIYIYGADLSITYTWNDQKYNVSISCNGGTSSPSGTVQVQGGESITVTAQGNKNYEFSSLTVGGSSVQPSVTETSLNNGICLFHLDGNNVDELGNATLNNSIGHSTTSRFGSGSIYLNGSSYFSIDIGQNYSPITIECWFYVTSSNSSGIYPTLFSMGSQNGNGGTYMHIDDGSYSVKPVCRSNTSSGNNNGGYGSTTISRNTWHHFAYCRDGSSHYFFIDGNLEYTVTQSSPQTTSTIYFGGLMGSGSMKSGCYMTGYIDEILVSSVCKWTGSFAAPTSSYDADTTYVYTYTLDNINSDITVIFTFVDKSGNATHFVKLNGSWVPIITAYKKINGSWVAQSSLNTLITENVNYVYVT